MRRDNHPMIDNLVSNLNINSARDNFPNNPIKFF